MIYALEQGCRYSGTEFLAGAAAMDAMNRIGQLVDPHLGCAASQEVSRASIR